MGCPSSLGRINPVEQPDSSPGGPPSTFSGSIFQMTCSGRRPQRTQGFGIPSRMIVPSGNSRSCATMTCQERSRQPGQPLLSAFRSGRCNRARNRILDLSGLPSSFSSGANTWLAYRRAASSWRATTSSMTRTIRSGIPPQRVHGLGSSSPGTTVPSACSRACTSTTKPRRSRQAGQSP